MYWYYKYPFLLVCLLIVFGIGYFIYTRLPEGVTDSIEQAEIFQGEIEKQAGDGKEQDVSSSKKTVADGAKEKNKQPRDRKNSEATSLMEKQLNAASEQLQSGKLLAARTLARKVVEHHDTIRFGRHWTEAARIISEVNTRLINSDIPCPEKVRYEIASGDNLVNIARRFDTTVSALQRGNPALDVNDPTIYPGTTLLVYHGEWWIEVLKNRFVLLLMDGEHLFKLYPIAIGRQGRTPEGEFVIKNRQFHPDWTPPGRHIPYGDPENVLGTHWLGLRPVADTDKALSGYGIHGTWEPESIGTAASLGCVRMRNESINELYDIVRLGTKVVIRGEE